MTAAEPVTAVTDYLLAVVYLVFAVRLFREGRAQRQVSLQLASGAFLATVLGAVVGGTYHWIGGEILWKTTVYCVGLTGFFMIATGSFVALAGPARQAILISAGLQFAAYAVWVAGHDDFRYVIYDYAAAMILTLSLFAWRRSRSFGWIAAAVMVTFAASAVQVSGFDLDRYLNHNDLYHLIQIGAAWLFYRGFRDSKDRYHRA